MLILDWMMYLGQIEIWESIKELRKRFNALQHFNQSNSLRIKFYLLLSSIKFQSLQIKNFRI